MVEEPVDGSCGQGLGHQLVEILITRVMPRTINCVETVNCAAVALTGLIDTRSKNGASRVLYLQLRLQQERARFVVRGKTNDLRLPPEESS